MSLHELRGPRYFLMNMGLFRQFSVNERFRPQPKEPEPPGPGSFSWR